MTVDTLTRRAGPFDGTGVQTEFPFDFKVFAAAEVYVYSTEDGDTTELTLDTDFTVELNADQDESPGGTVTMLVAPTVDQTVEIEGFSELLQPVALPQGGRFSPIVIEGALDRLTLICQQLQDILDSGRPGGGGIAIDAIDGVPSALDRALKVLGFDADGAPIAVTIPDLDLEGSLGDGTQILLSAAGSSSWRQEDENGDPQVEYLYYGTANAGDHGIGPGMAGVNTGPGVDWSVSIDDEPVLRLEDTVDGVDFALGAGNTLVYDATTEAIGVGMAPVAGNGALQLLGSAAGGIAVGNVDNTDSVALDWYEEGTWTPALKVNNLFGTTTYSAASGTWQRIGNRIFFDGQIQINVFDGSTGSLKISATSPIPYAAVTGTFPVTVHAQGIGLLSPGWLSAGLVAAGGAPDVTVRLASVLGSTSVLVGTTLTLSGGSILAVSGSYPCA